MADNLYTVLSSLQVSKEEIIEAETFSRQYLRSYYPDLDLREGVALSDLIIRPFATLLAVLKKGQDYYFSSNTISGITDDSPEDMVDKLLSNWFLTRLNGSSALVKTRLYFISNNRDIYIPATSTFSTDNVTIFKPIVDVFISSSELVYDSFQDEYYYDLTLISTSQDEVANLESGDFIYHSNIDPYFLQASILYLEGKAIPKETNTEFISRAETAISTRNLINNPSIDSLIKKTFNYITQVVPVGYGEEEMFRDLIRVVNPVTLDNDILHVGGKVDIYVNSEVEEDLIIDRATDASGVIEIAADDLGGSLIIYDIQIPLAPGGSAYTFEVGGYDESGNWSTVSFFNTDVGFSYKQYIRIIFADGPAVGNTNVSLQVKRFTDVATVQNFLDDPEVKVVSADYLARALDRYSVDININKVGVNTLLIQEELDTSRVALQSFFDKIAAGESLVVSDLVNVLINEAGIDNLNVQIGVSYTLYDRTFKKLLGLPGATGTITTFMGCERTQRFVLGNVTSI